MTVIPLHSANAKNGGSVPGLSGKFSSTIVFSEKNGILAEEEVETGTIVWHVMSTVPGTKSTAPAARQVETYRLNRSDFHWVRPAPEPTAEKLPAKK